MSSAHWNKVINLRKVLDANDRIASSIHRTDILRSSTLDGLVGKSVFLKGECFQKTGSFKARGALNAILKAKCDSDSSCSGIVTHSSGNHGQAVAWASKMAALPCAVVVPNNTSQTKKDAIVGYGAELINCEPTYVSRLETCQKVADERSFLIVPPFDHYDVMAGQGTIATEFLEQVPSLDAILVPISGGGMTAGIAVAAKAIKPSIKVYAVEPEGKNLAPCLESGERLWPNPPVLMKTIAEGIRTQQCGHLTFPVLCDLVEKTVFTVSDKELSDAMKFTFERIKVVIEVSSAAGIAALLKPNLDELLPSSVHNVGVILCGGNADLTKLPWL